MPRGRVSRLDFGQIPPASWRPPRAGEERAHADRRKIHCGRITYRAEIDPKAVYACHCADCQAISGSPFRWAVPVAAGDFALLSGTTRIYEKTGASGRPNHQHFCEDCAAPIFSATPGAEPALYRLRLGTARQRNLLVPRRQLWCRSAQDWALVPAVECLDTQ